MGHSLYVDSHLSSVCVQIEACISTVPVGDAVASGAVSCYNFIGHSKGFLRQYHSAETAGL